LADEVRITVGSDADLVLARQRGRELADRMGFSRTDATLIATAISELARNMLTYAGSGEIALRSINENGREGVSVVAVDSGPGIDDVEVAMAEGYSTSGGLGLGLPGARRLMDEFQIRSEFGKGTQVMVKKWRARATR
jgi:serine/threonine-protein kinase RsbT